MELNPIVLSIPIYFVLIGIEVVYDRIKNRKLYRLNDALTNISCGITEQVTGVFAKVLTVAVYHFVFTHFRLFEVPQTWYWAVVLFIGVDFFYYWAHRFDHEVNLLWTGHVVHHQSEDYNFSVALRQGALQKVFNVIFFLPLAILGFETEWFIYIGAFSTLYQFWIHTEAIDKLPRWFEFVFNTPSHHRVHHGRNPQYIDKNHGGTFIIFDRIFGTFEEEKEAPTYGITTPVNSFNPLAAHVHPFRVLWKEMNKVSGWANRIRLLFKPPGWLPAEDGGTQTPPSVDRNTYHKYSVHITRPLQFYVLVQYALVLAGAAFYLFSFAELSMANSALAALGILASVAGIGFIFDHRPQARYVEYFRLVGSFLLVIYFLQGSDPSIAMLVSLIAILVLSLVVYASLKKQVVNTLS